MVKRRPTTNNNGRHQPMRSGEACSDPICTITFRHKYYGCEPCGMGCTSAENHAAHVNGRKHQRNLVRGQNFVHCRVCDVNIRAGRWHAHTPKGRYLASSMSMRKSQEEIMVDIFGHKFCTTCQTHIIEEAWGAHLASLRHEKQKGFSEFKDVLRREIGDNGGRVILNDVFDFEIVDPLVARSGISLQAIIQAASQSKISLVDIRLASERYDVPSPFSVSRIGRQTFITPTKFVILNIAFKQAQVGKYTETVTFIFENLHLKKRFSISRSIQAIIGSPELHMSDIDMVPPEIWSNILFFATRPPSQCYPLTATTHQPFDPSPADNLVGHLSTLQLRARIVLVSHQWNALGTPYLYEFLRLSHSSRFEGLIAGLKRSSGQGRVARYVRCAVLPYERGPFISPLLVLELLPNLEVLIRSQNPPYEWPMPGFNDRLARTLPLGSISLILGTLKRIDCTEHRFAGATTGGLNHLPSILRACTGLEYLSISGDLHESVDEVNLPSLVTLRAERFVSTDRFCKYWVMDNLRHVVLHLNLYHTRLLKFWRQFGQKLHTVELATSPGDDPRLNDEISDVLQYCPNLKELSYHIEFSQAPSFRNGVHTSLTALRLHAGYPDSSITRRLPQFDQIASHFDAFSKRMVPCLEEVTLCGVWTDDKPIHGIKSILQKFGTNHVAPKERPS